MSNERDQLFLLQKSTLKRVCRINKFLLVYGPHKVHNKAPFMAGIGGALVSSPSATSIYRALHVRVHSYQRGITQQKTTGLFSVVIMNVRKGTYKGSIYRKNLNRFL
jgi:hypothetical protein